MLKDDLAMMGANSNTWTPTSDLGVFKSIGKGITTAATVAAPFVPLLLLDDNSLTCDSAGNCMLKSN